MKRNKHLGALLLCLAIVYQAPGQEQRKLEIGVISWLSLSRSGADASPLQTNRGDVSFSSDWTILLGAEITEKLSFFAEVQSRNGFQFVNYGASFIYQPFETGLVNLEAGKFLAPFGNFLSRKWPSENALQNWPLVYDYRTSLSAFSLPANNRALLLARGQGHRLSYLNNAVAPKHSSAQPNSIPAIPGQGMRLLSRQVYLSGLQLFGSSRIFNYRFGVTNGALSNPVNINNSSALQLIGRVAIEPTMGFELAGSAAWGAYLDKNSLEQQISALGKTVEDFRQTALGLDFSYSIGHLEVFAEAMRHSWETPLLAENLDALAYNCELVYRIKPRLYLAGRFSRIDFGDISDPEDIDLDGRNVESWDFDVHQVELGMGYSFNRNGLLKLIHVVNRTATGFGDPKDNLWLSQVVVSF